MAFGLIALILAAIYRPLGDYMYRVYTTDKDLFFEKWIYRIIGVDSSKGQSWKAYFRGVLGFSVMSLLVLYLLQRVQSWLPFSLGFDNVPAPLAFNTAASFVTNTNWQSYSPDQTLGYSVQIAGLCVQTSFPPRSASPYPSPWCEASCCAAPTRSAISGWTSSVARSASSCP